MTVLDSSALLCFLLGEPGADLVEQELDATSRCSAVNWSEIAQKAAARGLNWPATRQLLLGYGLSVEPVGLDDAEAAALLWADSPQLSIADRLCLALGRRLDELVLTADRAWGESTTVRQVRPGPVID